MDVYSSTYVTAVLASLASRREAGANVTMWVTEKGARPFFTLRVGIAEIMQDLWQLFSLAAQTYTITGDVFPVVPQ